MTQPKNLDTHPNPNLGVAALVGAAGLLMMAVLAPPAFGALDALVVPTDGTATVHNIAATMRSFRASIAALLIVALLDIVVAWAMWQLLRGINDGAATLVAWLRVAYTAGLVVALGHLLQAAQLVDAGATLALPPEWVAWQVSSLIAAFRSGFSVALAVFGLHLVGLGLLLTRSALVPRWLAVLVSVAGAGYMVDAFGAIVVSGYDLAVARFTFVGEALLIFWLAYRGIRALRSRSGSSTSIGVTP